MSKYLEIATALKQEARSGAPGALFASDTQVCERFGVARETARRALAEVEADGLIHTVHGRGRFIAGAQAMDVAHVAAVLRAEAEQLGPGQRFASETELMTRFGITRYTARAVLAKLEGSGVIATRLGRGRFVV